MAARDDSVCKDVHLTCDERSRVSARRFCAVPLARAQKLLLSSQQQEAMVVAQRAEKNTAAPYAEFWSGTVFLLAGSAFLAGASSGKTHSVPLSHLFYYCAGLSLVMAAAFLAAFLTVGARRRGPRIVHTAAYRIGKSLPPPLERVRLYADRAYLLVANVDWRGDWLAIIAALLLSLTALFALAKGWRMAVPAPTQIFNQLSAGVLLVSAFPLLVLQRKYAGMPERLLPEAPLLARICRLALLGVLGLALAGALRWLALPFAETVEHVIVAIIALVAMEFCLRSVVYVFMPLPPLETRRSHADSIVAGLIRPQLPSPGAFSASVRRQFGIDLARSWALGFIRRAMVPLLLGMVLFSWMLTGVTALGLNERAVYEAFGTPRAVLHPGLHVHLPWPFGVLRPVEYGAVREIPIKFTADGSAPQEMRQGAIADIEGAPPPSADRLWDSTHEEEGSYLVASDANGRQSFEAVDIDLSVVYRIGLSDDDALQAAYHIDAPEAAVQAVSGQILARYFARYVIGDILGQNREAFIRNFQNTLQSRLAALSSGIDIMAVVVEGIHPPPKAAISYQGVQAAAIESEIKVSTARAESAREMKMAALVANSTRNDATAAALERVSQAKTDFTLFDGDRKSYAAGGPSFLFERRLDRLDQGLADKPVIVVDHRIAAGAMPTFDMRQPRATAGSNLTPSDD
jgi:regulator of protease activity HflC (stomatin/prohibitin superfamily)